MLAAASRRSSPEREANPSLADIYTRIQDDPYPTAAAVNALPGNPQAKAWVLDVDGSYAEVVSASFSGTIGTVGQGTPAALSGAWPVEVTDGTNVLGTVAHPLNVTGSSGGGAVTVADGADVAEGATTDAADTTGTTGTISGKLRGLVTLIASLIGSAGTASTAVLSVQGIASATAVITDPNAARRGTLTDRSGTITSGGTAQSLAGSNASRKYLLIVNPITATEPLYVNFTTTAVAGSPSIGLNPGDSFVMENGFVSTEAISVIAATTSHTYTAKEG